MRIEERLHARRHNICFGQQKPFTKSTSTGDQRIGISLQDESQVFDFWHRAKSSDCGQTTI